MDTSENDCYSQEKEKRKRKKTFRHSISYRGHFRRFCTQAGSFKRFPLSRDGRMRYREIPPDNAQRCLTAYIRRCETDWLYHAERVNELGEIDVRSNAGVIARTVAAVVDGNREYGPLSGIILQTHVSTGVYAISPLRQWEVDVNTKKVWDALMKLEKRARLAGTHTVGHEY